MEQQKYVYPVGDFLSGFSEDENNPCDYELECQRMVIRGVEYFDNHPELFDLITTTNVNTSDDVMEPMVKYMCLNEENPEESEGQTGAMVSHTVKVAYHAKKMGWNVYIEKITDKSE